MHTHVHCSFNRFSDAPTVGEMELDTLELCYWNVPYLATHVI